MKMWSSSGCKYKATDEFLWHWGSEGINLLGSEGVNLYSSH